MPSELEPGMFVRKIKGLPFGNGDAQIVAIYEAKGGKRCVVQHPDGWQHIFTPDQLEATLEQPLSETVGDYVLVPREPTDEMLDQGVAALENRQPDEWVPPSRVWEAMLSAAPIIDHAAALAASHPPEQVKREGS